MNKIKLPNSKTIKTLAIIAAVLLALFAAKSLLQKIGLFKTGEERQALNRARQSAKRSKEKVVKESQKASMPAIAWKGIADQLHEDLKYSEASDHKRDAIKLLKRPLNDADFVLLQEQFGTRSESWFGIPTGSAEFTAYISSNLMRSSLDSINKDYAAKGITFRW